MSGNKVTQKQFILSAVYSLVLCLPIGGFIWGFCVSTEYGFNIFGRLFIGLIGVAAATLTLGHDVETGDPIPAIYFTEAIVFVALNVAFYMRNKRKLKH
jgi:hypothetical protein